MRIRLPDLTEEMKQEGRDWRIMKCGSPRHEDLREQFDIECRKKHNAITKKEMKEKLRNGLKQYYELKLKNLTSIIKKSRRLLLLN